MKKTTQFTLIGLGLLISACGADPSGPLEAPAEEPTLPEATEMWTPVPNQIDPFG